MVQCVLPFLSLPSFYKPDFHFNPFHTFQDMAHYEKKMVKEDNSINIIYRVGLWFLPIALYL